METNRRAAALVLALVLGGAAGLGACRGGCSSITWAADRGAGALLALGDDLCVLEQLAVPSPRLLDSRGGEAWIAGTLSREDPDARFLWRVGRLVPPGGARARFEPRRAAAFTALVALCAQEDGSALTLDRGADGETFLWRIDRELHRTLLGSFPGARALAACAGEILVGCASGELVRLRADGSVLALERGGAERGERVLALAPGPCRGEWWRLSGDEARLALLDAQLVPRWSTRTLPGAAAFAPIAGEERVWIAHGSRVRAHGAGGTVEIELELPGGPWQAASAAPGRALLRGEGALLELATRGGRARVRCTQGGFAALAALVPSS